MLSEFKCNICESKFLAAFSGEIQPGLPMKHCVACGNDNIRFIRPIEEAVEYGRIEQENKKLEIANTALKIEMGGFRKLIFDMVRGEVK